MKFLSSAFICPCCGIYSSMTWSRLYSKFDKNYTETLMHVARCLKCNNVSYWMQIETDKDSMGELLLPKQCRFVRIHDDMPNSVRKDFVEAISIVEISKRGAAALLRLSLQKLCLFLGEKGDNLNKDIGELVKKGMPIEIQQALDIVRVVGNNSVHPGWLSEEDDSDIVENLFEIINQIVEDRIARPKGFGKY